MLSESPFSASAQNTSPQARGVPGHWVVAGMFAFGLLATGVLFAYWHYHTAPFQELQAALAEEFPGSRPRAEGGQRKQHKATPQILRIILKVDFHPEKETQKSERMADRVLKIAGEHHDLSPYDMAEIHLYWPEKEKQLHEHTVERPLKTPAGI